MRLTPSPWLVHQLIWGLTRTLNIHTFGVENARVASHLSSTGTFVACHWHQSLLMTLAPHHHMRVATLVSRSRDGQITADYLDSIGMRTVRGSSSRGAAAGVLELMRALSDGYHIVLNLDGPRGPYKRVKNGAIEIARRCRVPLLPIAARANRELSLTSSWDRFRVPMPGSHLYVCYGAPIMYPPEEPDEETLDQRRRDLACVMHDLEAEAARRAHRRDRYPHPRHLAWMRGVDDSAARKNPAP
jgi:lysophospholipid acyltransferase (LPLAT)-like uncharacterized protein